MWPMANGQHEWAIKAANGKRQAAHVVLSRKTNELSFPTAQLEGLHLTGWPPPRREMFFPRDQRLGEIEK